MGSPFSYGTNVFRLAMVPGFGRAARWSIISDRSEMPRSGVGSFLEPEWNRSVPTANR